MRRFLHDRGRAVLSALVGWCLFLLVPAAHAQARCSQGLYVKWEFRAGNPVVAPPVFAEKTGQIMVGTREGYVHSLHSDGAFRWSYSLAGGLLWGLQFVSPERVLAPTTSRSIYALGLDGQLHWVYKSPIRPEQALVSPERGLVYFSAGPYLFAARTGLLFRVELKAEVHSPLLNDGQGAVWLVTRDQRLHRVRSPFYHQSWALPNLPGATQLQLHALSDAVALLAGAELRVITAKGEQAWSRSEIHSVAAVDSAAHTLVAMTTRGDVLWLDARSGNTLSAVTLPRYEPPAPAALAATEQRVFVGEGTGRLRVWDRAGHAGWCKISQAPLLQPVYDAARDQLLVMAGDGTLVAVGFGEGWP